jgi:hypothetical protein
VSDNIEEHAKPDSFSGYYPHYIKPDINYAYYNTQNIINQLIEIKRLNPDAPYEIKFDHKQRPYAEGRLPKLLLKIKDSDIEKLSFEKNEDYYNKITPEVSKSELHVRQHFMQTINNIKVRDITCQCNNKPIFSKIFSNSTIDNDAMAYSSCKHTIFAAAKRQIKSAPTPDEQTAHDFINYAKKIIDKEIGEDLDHFGYSFSQWYNHLTKPKQELMNKITEAIQYDKPTILSEADIRKLIKWQDDMITSKGKRKYTSINAEYSGICKVEIQTIDGKPRMVCSIPDLIKFVMGAVTWKLEEICSHKLKGYCGGKNLDEMSDMVNRYISQGFTRVVEGDGSGFDNTQDVMLKEIDRYIYQRVEKAVYHTQSASKWKELFRIFSQAYYKTMNIEYVDKNSKKKKTIMTYSILGTVFSGDCDTTLANTIRMALYNRYTMDKAGFRYGHDYIAFSKGDDFTVMFNPTHITDKQVEDAYWRYFLKKPEGEYKQYDNRIFGLGQICKFLEFGPPNIIKFCSLRAWYINKQETKIRLTRDPAKFLTLAKYSRKMKAMKPIEKYAYLMDQALALEVSYKGLNYFDTMTALYRQQANIRLKQYNLTIQHYYKYIEKQQKIKESRVTLPNDEYIDMMSAFYDTTGREHDYKINGTYWQTMQRIERAANKKYTQDELDIVNTQINAEFDPEELWTLLAQHEY